MNSEDNNFQYPLSSLGWNSFFSSQVTEEQQQLIPARVSRQDLNRYQLLSEQGILWGSLPGRTRVEITSKAELPTVGDWVLVSQPDDEQQVTIQKTLDRQSKFSRKEAGEKFDEQVVAANIDIVLIVTGLDDNFNPKRIERYLLLAWNSGATPIIVLNKADLCPDTESKLEAVDKIAMGTRIITVSALTGDGVQLVKQFLSEGTTLAVLGSSGAGKSTLINAVLGHDHFKTGEVRDGDSKGRHTTTHRELCQVETGGLVIDTPGMREIQLWADDSTFSNTFSDIEDLALQCKFTDCGHDTEPGCAITAALKSGELKEDRWQSYLKFQRELEHFAEQQGDMKVKMEKKAERKKFSKMVKNLPNKRT